VGLRLDPVVLRPGWEDAYADLLARWADVFRGGAFEAVEIGTFRCSKRAAEAIRGGKHRALVAGELLPHEDGKLRYFWPLRLRAYRVLLDAVRRTLGPEVRVRLCMEPPWMVDRVFRPGEGSARRPGKGDCPSGAQRA
jgi:hypothetical protein